MEKIRGKSLQEWKEYCNSENVPVKTMKYIVCLEERIKQLTLTDVGCSETELVCDHKWRVIFNSGNYIIGNQCTKCNEYIAY